MPDDSAVAKKPGLDHYTVQICLPMKRKGQILAEPFISLIRLFEDQPISWYASYTVTTKALTLPFKHQLTLQFFGLVISPL